LGQAFDLLHGCGVGGFELAEALLGLVCPVLSLPSALVEGLEGLAVLVQEGVSLGELLPGGGCHLLELLNGLGLLVEQGVAFFELLLEFLHGRLGGGGAGKRLGCGPTRRTPVALNGPQASAKLLDLVAEPLRKCLGGGTRLLLGRQRSLLLAELGRGRVSFFRQQIEVAGLCA
jgi:hypothetical protein